MSWQKGIFNGLDYYWLSVHDNVKTFWYIFSFAYNYNGILKRGRNHNEMKKDNHQWLQTQFNSIYPIELSSEFKKVNIKKSSPKIWEGKKKKMYSHLRLSDGFIQQSTLNIVCLRGRKTLWSHALFQAPFYYYYTKREHRGR